VIRTLSIAAGGDRRSIAAPPHPGNTISDFPNCGTGQAQASSFSERPQDILDRLAGVRPTTPYECDFECRDQSQVTVEIHENLIHDKEGRAIGIRSALLDVTARRMVDMAVKKVEQYARELRTKNEELLLALGVAREASE
jgi:hypothetical protein